MLFKTIHSLGSRCQNSDVLKYYGYREFSGFFDFINTQKVETLIHILRDEFKEILKRENNISIPCDHLTIDPETGEKLEKSIRTINIFYNPDVNDMHSAIFPHHDLNKESDYIHFLKCKDRFKKLSRYNTLFNYSFNRWENDITTKDMEEIVKILKEVYGMVNFKICFIGIGFGDSRYDKISESEYFDVWHMYIGRDSFTGGLFGEEIDNQNYISIIKNYNIDDNRITLEKIDK